MTKATKQSPIFLRVYDLLLWLLPVTAKFPKNERFRLAKRIDDAAFELHDCLMRAARNRDLRWLREADLRLDRLRTCVRLSQEMKILAFKQYEHCSQRLEELGRLIGGWMTKVER